MEIIIIWFLATPLIALFLYYLFPKKSVLVALSCGPLVAFLLFEALFWGGMGFRHGPSPTNVVYAKEVFDTLVWICGQLVAKLWFAALFAFVGTMGAIFVCRRYHAWMVSVVAFIVAAFFSNLILRLLSNEGALVMILVWSFHFAVIGKLFVDVLEKEKSLTRR